MRKYIYCITVAVLAMVLCTGCGAGIELSDEENAMVAEYMAAALLKYDAYYEDELIYAEAAETTKDEFVPVDSIDDERGQQNSELDDTQTDSSNTEVVTVSTDLNEVFKGKKYSVSYLGVEEYETYKEEGNDYFILEAPNGYKLMVVQFTIANTSEEDIVVTLADKGITYELVLGDNTTKKPLLTALMSGLQYYNETISKGESKVGVVVFAVEKESDISNSAVLISNEDGVMSRVSLQK